jgi:hypothetical protein
MDTIRLRIKRACQKSLDYAVTFFSVAPGALQSHLNTEELMRIAVASLSAGGGIFGLLEAIMRSAGVVFPAPSDAALAAALLTMILESHRRLQHGDEPRRSRAAR